ncbi:zinc finger CCCH domain-containing protein 18-like [Salvia splendens]|uniref:zinc finger CCCH domain-containing protein 18-like n=1 Tax=Salvia splendens TaxID=180675 RepID=UPI001100232C|nr:zinc finger CCCH domain-containing protein 18-like [Salvia splendens]
MSRREDRSSEPKRHRSRFDREPSPKRSRRDGKPETERPPTDPDLDRDRSDRVHRHHRRLPRPPRLEYGNLNRRESDRGADGHKESDPAKIPQSRSYFQHDGRDNTGQNGRGFSRRTESECGWWPDSKEQRNDRSINKTVSIDAQLKDEKSKDNREGSHMWHHDGYFEMEGNHKPPARRRPSFREQKIPADPEKPSKAADDPVLRNPQDHAIDGGRRNNRVHNSRYSDRPERPVAGERELNNAQPWRGNFPSREGLNSNGRQRGRDNRFTPRQGNLPSGGRVEKWKHDLYDEANRSPPRKNEEDQISKIESLLAS